MKMTPVSQGSGVPSADVGLGHISGDAKSRAIAAMTGQEVTKTQESTGNPQADRALRSIKMKTQVSPDRQEPEPALDPVEQPVSEQSASLDTNVEAPKVEAEKPLSPQFAQLAKAKRALQIERAALEKAKSEWEASKGQGQDLTGYVSRDELKTKPLSVLLENGVTYDQLTEALLNGQGPNPEILSLKGEIDSLKKELSNQFSERDKLAEQQVLSQMKRDVSALVSSTPELKAIQAANAHNEVVNLVHRVWQKGWPEQGYQPGDVMDLHVAAKLVDSQIREEAMPFVDLLRPQAPIQQAQEPQPIQAPKPGNRVTMRTLTNRDSASPTMSRRARAIAAAEGRLKR